MSESVSTKNTAVSSLREPWFWVVFAPLIIVAMVSSVLVSFAYIGADDRVYDDYYKQGRMINNQFDAEKTALALGVRGDIRITQNMETLTLHLSGRSDPDIVSVQFSHPSKADQDTLLELERQAPGVYSGSLQALSSGRWYVIVSALEPDVDSVWRVSTEMSLSPGSSGSFAAHR